MQSVQTKVPYCAFLDAYQVNYATNLLSLLVKLVCDLPKQRLIIVFALEASFNDPYFFLLGP